ncbi:MAG: hypothetical protein UR12_C0006G0008 [candidate division TM6 bacterium GW2011_GWF2_30_66]|jgi:hypothetical protein|nr:MAG: hypothetical protein UR12_C0006G0008 [candidate division TM6 bacterium GW2011_GWF2_30_66]
MNTNNPVFGMILIIFGCAILVAILLPVLIHLLFLLLALYLINYGLIMRNMPHLSYFIKLWWFQIKRFM